MILVSPWRGSAHVRARPSCHGERNQQASPPPPPIPMSALAKKKQLGYGMSGVLSSQHQLDGKQDPNRAEYREKY